MARATRKQTVPQPGAIQAIPMSLDVGNGYIKAVCGDKYVLFPHALASIPEAMWEQARSSMFHPAAEDDYIAVHDGDRWRYYVTGTSAFSYTLDIRQQNRSKYERGYYGVFLASAMARMFKDNLQAIDQQQFTIYASHAPRERAYSKQIRTSMKGEWSIKTWNTALTFDIGFAATFAEPFGGYLHRTCIWQNDRDAWTLALRDQRVGIIDIGAGTVSSYEVDRNGLPVDHGIATTDVGVNSVLDQFTQAIQQTHTDRFSVAPPDQEEVERALRGEPVNGKSKRIQHLYRGFGTALDVTSEAEEALRRLETNVNQLFRNNLGGGRALDALILTGGGTALVHQTITNLLAMDNILLADDDLRYIQFANAVGAFKYLQMSGDA